MTLLPVVNGSNVLDAEEVRRLQETVRSLADERKAVILAHNYEVPEVQDVADFVGDSLALARQAASTEAEVIVLCGVYFMAETAKIINPARVVLIPDETAGCSLAESITVEQLRAWKAEYTDAVVVSYVNSSAAIKAESDYCVTSGNAEAVIRAIPEDRQILFLPDMFLGDWLKRQTGRENMQVWMGECHVHAGIRPEEIRARLAEYPGASLMIHPECGCTSQYVWAKERGMLGADTQVLSTEGMVRYGTSAPNDTFLVATETGLLHRLRQEAPDRRFIPADDQAVCRYMKQITLPKLASALRDLRPEVTVPPDIAGKARLAIERMLAIGR